MSAHPLPRNVLYYGSETPLPGQTTLRAGPLSAVFQEGDLRYVRFGEREVLRRVTIAIRDRNWGTVTPQLENVRLQVDADAFEITYDVTNRQNEIDFFWQGRITGEPDGTLRFTMDGEARSTFHRSRIGFCVLHPIRECAGQPALVEHVDGSVEKGTFPRYISPHQPFLEMRAITHEVAPGVQAEVRFEGDTFEMEDHRNWTDASYKTYCTPLRLPYPVEVPRGTRLSQSVTVRLVGEGTTDDQGSRRALARAAASDSGRTRPTTNDQRPTTDVDRPSELVVVGHSSLVVGSTAPSGPRLPRIGLGVASHGQPLSEREVARLRTLNLAYLRVDLRLGEAGYADRLRQAAAEAARLGVALEIALHLSGTARDELKAFGRLLQEVRPPVSAWTIFQVGEKSTSEQSLRLAREYLAEYDSSVPIVGGTNTYFAELNRGRPEVSALDQVCYSINPQVHAFDNTSLVENLEAQAETVESARQFAHNRPLAVGPVTLKARFNPNATGPAPEPGPGELPEPVDTRQLSLFGAGWTLGSIKYLSQSGAVARVTYYETTGWRGVMETETGSPQPDLFRSIPGAVFPLYHVLADVGEFACAEVLPLRTSDPLLVDGLALRKDGRTRVLVANLSPAAQTVTIDDLPASVALRVLDETNVEEAMRSPEGFRSRAPEVRETTAGKLDLELRPYAIVTVDSPD